MDKTPKDISILEHIIEWCDDVAETHAKFGDNEQIFRNDKDYFRSISMCLLQIGELANHLSKNFQEKYTQFPCAGAISLRHIITHGYGTLMASRMWEISHEHTVELKKQCIQIISEIKISNRDDS